MESYSSDEEQVEALRKWWQENGKSTIVAIVLALGASLGWQSWQGHRASQAETASAIYQDLLEAVNISLETELSSEQLATARHLGGTLKADFSGSTYAQFAALHLARLAVGENELETAEQELRWVLSANPPLEIQQLSQLRLARVVAAGGDSEAALAMLQVESANIYAAAYAEAEGDIYFQTEQPEQARTAYEKASMLVSLEGSAPSRSLELKLQSLSPLPPRDFELAPQED